MLESLVLLVSAYDQKTFDGICIDFTGDIIHSYALCNTFKDSIGFNDQLTGDSITLFAVSTMDILCVGLGALASLWLVANLIATIFYT